ncbi:MAG: lysophospholipid acyltransferase family protein [Pseudomonadota bacterium]
MKLFFARILLRLSAWLPLPLTRVLALVLGKLVNSWPGRPFKRTRQRIFDHLQLAFPEKSKLELRDLRRRNLIEMLSTVLESGPLWYRSGEWLEQRVQLNGWEQVEQAQNSGRGVLFVSGHIGNWEANALYLTLRLPIVFLYKAPRSKKVDELLIQRRARFGGHFVAAGSPALRQILRQLKTGGAAGLMFDQRPKAGDSVIAPFFGQPVETMTLVHELAKRTGCLVLMVACTRLPDSAGWKISIKPMDEAFDQLNSTQAASHLNAALEQWIRKVPAQYLWQYKRFSTGN